MSEMTLSPRWARLVKIEEVETETYFIDVYVSQESVDELIKKHIDEPPVLYAFAVFNRENTYLLSYALEIRKAYKPSEDGETEIEYIGYFLETYCKSQQFSCKNFKDIAPPFETVRSFVISLINEYDAVPKMLAYDAESLARNAENSAASSDEE